MQILNAIRNVSQLHGMSQLPTWIKGVTHKHRAINVKILPDELIDVPILHPLRNHYNPVFIHRYPKQRQDARVPEVLPGDTLSVESLHAFIHTSVTTQEKCSR